MPDHEIFKEHDPEDCFYSCKTVHDFMRLTDEMVHTCFLQALFPQKCRLTSSKLHGEFPHYCISSSGTLSGAGEESLQAYKVY